ncbi:hypothetical protein BU17DRAFT_82252 [Hysterangium stoloniferum]|nr:hypothetical protein BU17DRAFT_82252 [Hysterangium stoloniferum]
MPRRPPPTALRLHPGPTPPRSHPKHTLPSVPRPAFYAPKAAPIPDRVHVASKAMPWEVELGISSKKEEPRMRGPWDRSRSLGESTVDVSMVIRAPERVKVVSPMV